MPGEAPNRWEGTHTYKKPEAEKRRARTVAQLREEAAAKSKASREAAINKRRGSIYDQSTAAGSGRRGSTGSINPPRRPTAAGEPEPEEEMPGSSKKSRNASGESPGVDPALRDFLNAMKQDIVQSTKDTVGQIEARLDKNERSIQALQKKVDDVDKNIGERIAVEVARQLGF